MTAQFCVLMYHGLTDTGGSPSDLGTNDPVYTITAAAFAKQLELLSFERFQAVSLGRLIQEKHSALPLVALTFDDGNRSDVTHALPLLLHYGFTATFYITTEWIGQPGFVSETDIRRLFDAGMEIGSHGHTHRYFDEMTEEELAGELSMSTSILASIVGDPITALSAPGGRLHRSLERIAKDINLQTISTSRVALFNDRSNLCNIPRMSVRQATSHDELQAMVSGKRRFYMRQSVRSFVLNTAKRMLGNRRYEFLRDKMG